MNRWYLQEQIIGFLCEADAGMSEVPAKKLCRRRNFSGPAINSGAASTPVWR